MSVTLEEFIIVYSCLRYTNATTCPEIPRKLIYPKMTVLIFSISIFAALILVFSRDTFLHIDNSSSVCYLRDFNSFDGTLLLLLFQES